MHAQSLPPGGGVIPPSRPVRSVSPVEVHAVARGLLYGILYSQISVHSSQHSGEWRLDLSAHLGFGGRVARESNKRTRSGPHCRRGTIIRKLFLRCTLNPADASTRTQCTCRPHTGVRAAQHPPLLKKPSSFSLLSSPIILRCTEVEQKAARRAIAIDELEFWARRVVLLPGPRVQADRAEVDASAAKVGRERRAVRQRLDEACGGRGTNTAMVEHQ